MNKTEALRVLRQMLSFSESDPEVAVDPALVATLQAEISDEDYASCISRAVPGMCPPRARCLSRVCVKRCPRQ